MFDVYPFHHIRNFIIHTRLYNLSYSSTSSDSFYRLQYTYEIQQIYYTERFQQYQDTYISDASYVILLDAHKIDSYIEQTQTHRSIHYTTIVRSSHPIYINII